MLTPTGHTSQDFSLSGLCLSLLDLIQVLAASTHSETFDVNMSTADGRSWAVHLSVVSIHNAGDRPRLSITEIRSRLQYTGQTELDPELALVGRYTSDYVGLNSWRGETAAHALLPRGHSTEWWAGAIDATMCRQVGKEESSQIAKINSWNVY